MDQQVDRHPRRLAKTTGACAVRSSHVSNKTGLPLSLSDSPSDPTAAQVHRAPDSVATRERIVAAVALLIGLAGSSLFYGSWFRRVTLRANADPAATAAALLSPLAAVIAVIALLWFIPPVNAALARLLDRIRNPRPRTRRIVMVAIALVSAAYFYGTAVEFNRNLVPLIHDSNGHMVQAQLLAHGRLWTAAHPLADHLETFFVLTKPVYAAMYFPGTSLLYAPFLRLGMSPAVFGSLLCGAVIAMTYRLACELLDGVAAALVVPYMIGVSLMRELSVILISHHTVLLPSLLAVWAFLKWRRSAGADWRWAAAIGCFAGFAAITRPVEALAYAAAIGIAIMVVLRKQGAKRWLITLAAIVLAASPWLAIQLIFDRGVTGQWLLPPYEAYIRTFIPHTSYGSYDEHASPAVIPTNLQQKVDYYTYYILPQIRIYTLEGPWGALIHERLPATVVAVSPFPLVIAFWAVGVVGMRRGHRWIIPVAGVILFAIYVPFVFYLWHYAMNFVPLAALLFASGAHVLGRAFAPGRGGRSTEVLVFMLAVAVSLTGTPELNRYVKDSGTEWARSGVAANTRVPNEVQRPAVVMYRYHAPEQAFDPWIDYFHDEPVYTIDAVRPEDSPVARVQDLGPARNRELYAFFAEREPERNVYLFDRHSQRLTRLGTARELLDRGEPSSYA